MTGLPVWVGEGQALYRELQRSWAERGHGLSGEVVGGRGELWNDK